MGPTNYFLLIYNLSTRALEVEEWGADDAGALAAYSECEHRFEDVDDMEVVLVGADSLETVKVTHSHYFAQATGDLFEQLARDVVAARSGARPPASAA